jgi:hypothetical protein
MVTFTFASRAKRGFKEMKVQGARARAILKEKVQERRSKRTARDLIRLRKLHRDFRRFAIKRTASW